jgi:hypothetical protein
MTAEIYTVPAGEEAAFRAAWSAEAPPGLKLYRALRGGRFAALPAESPEEGVLLVVEEADAEGWTRAWAGRQGFLGAWRVDGLAVAHWSSPLMYQRAGGGVPGAALYVRDGGLGERLGL